MKTRSFLLLAPGFPPLGVLRSPDGILRGTGDPVAVAAPADPASLDGFGMEADTCGFSLSVGERVVRRPRRRIPERPPGWAGLRGRLRAERGDGAAGQSDPARCAKSQATRSARFQAGDQALWPTPANSV